jgi:hypothetical protein
MNRDIDDPAAAADAERQELPDGVVTDEGCASSAEGPPTEAEPPAPAKATRATAWRSLLIGAQHAEAEVTWEEVGATTRPKETQPAAPAGGQQARLYMKLKEYADYRRVGRTTLYEWRKLGLPTNGAEGKGLRIKVPEADAWLDAGGPELAIRESAERQAKKGRR